MNIFKQKSLKIVGLLGMIATLALPSVSFASDSDALHAQDRVVLTVKVGSQAGEVGYSASLQDGGEGPEAFAVEDRTIFISDNVHKRVNVYKDGQFAYDFATPYVSYIRSMVIAKDSVYLMDYDAGLIYTTDLQGNVVEKVSLPKGLESYRMTKLYKTSDGQVWLYYNDDASYSVSDLGKGIQTKISGFSKDGIKQLTVSKDKANAATIQSDSTIGIATGELLGSLQILDLDKDNNLYVDLFEQVDASKVAGEFTVRKYKNGSLAAIAPIDIEGDYFAPNNLLALTDDGDLYQIRCAKDQIQIVKKSFVEPAQFQSKVPQIKEQVLLAEKQEQLAGQSPDSIQLAANAPNNRTTTQTNANSMSSLTWTYSAANTVNPNSTNITTPDYLVGVSTPSSQTGIPYSWGGFDGLTTSSSSGWSNFKDAISKGKFAGNVNTDTPGYQSGTAGLDCSGFVSSSAGFSYKLSTTDLASTTYTASIAESSISIYDIYVKKGSHVLFYVGAYSGGIYTREATTSGDDKTKSYSRSTTFLSSNGYVLRRFNGW